MYKTICNGISEKTQYYANDTMCGIGDTGRTTGKIWNGTKKGGRKEQSLRIMNVSYAGTSNITYVK